MPLASIAYTGATKRQRILVSPPFYAVALSYYYDNGNPIVQSRLVSGFKSSLSCFVELCGHQIGEYRPGYKLSYTWADNNQWLPLLKCLNDSEPKLYHGPEWDEIVGYLTLHDCTETQGFRRQLTLDDDVDIIYCRSTIVAGSFRQFS